MSPPSLPVLLKAAALIAVSGMSGIFMGWSAVGQIDPFYYTPRIHGSRYVPDQAQYGMRDGQPAYAQPYSVDYPYAPAPAGSIEDMEPAVPADLMPDPIDDVSAHSNFRMASVTDTEPGGCIDCGGPYEPVGPAAEPAPVAGEILMDAPVNVEASALEPEVY
jgi:hypothetical protein